MATEDRSLVPTGTSKYSPWNSFFAPNNGPNYQNAMGKLVGSKSGLVLTFKCWGTQLTYRFNALYNGTTYNVVVDGGAPVTFTGDASSEASGRVDTWYTGLSNTWHTVEIRDYANAQFTNWGQATTDTEGGFAGAGGAIATYNDGTLPGGYASAFNYRDTWGPTSTMAQLASDLGTFADVLQGSTMWNEYMKGVAFIGTGSPMTVRIQTSGGNVVVYSSTANPSVTPTTPTPYIATDILSTSTVNSDGFIVCTFNTTNGVHYRLAIGVGSVTSINWGWDTRPTTTFAYQDLLRGATFLGDSTFAAGYVGGTGNLARSTAVYYWVLSGAQVRGMGISGSLASATTTSGAYDSGLGSFNGLRLPLAANTVTPFVIFRGWINDTLNGNYGFTTAWEVANPVNSRLMSAAQVADDTADAIDYIYGVDPAIQMLFAQKYWSGTSNTDYNATIGPLATAIAGRATAGRIVLGVDCNTWDTDSYAVTLDSGIHPTPDNAGAGNDARHWWVQVNNQLIPPPVPTTIQVQGTIQVEQGGSRPITVRVLDENGDPIDGLTVDAVSDNTGDITIGATATTDVDGYATFWGASAVASPTTSDVGDTATLSFSVDGAEAETIATVVSELTGGDGDCMISHLAAGYITVPTGDLNWHLFAWYEVTTAGDLVFRDAYQVGITKTLAVSVGDKIQFGISYIDPTSTAVLRGYMRGVGL